MDRFSFDAPIRWADIDFNGHLLHSRYYDLAVAARMKFLQDFGITTNSFMEFKMGPILFREEAVFRREIRLEDKVLISVKLIKATPDFSRWSVRHEFFKDNSTLAATVHVDGAWLDFTTRKLGKANETITRVFSEFPRSEDFQWLEAKA
jgi:acyl-CoA thioester hydrolase